jgi:MoaA/NifB/PqqE/SkfB family radical SAM enzyme
MTLRIDMFGAPIFVSWQLTRDCDLACLHCCTESAPGKRLADELDAGEAMRVAAEIVEAGVPYVMLCGGEPTIVPHFWDIAELLGRADVDLKIETNGQRFDAAMARRLARLPIRSIQISLDGDTQEVYERQRPGGSLARAHAACRAVRDAGLPLEVTFAPTRMNIHEAGAVIARARELGAFRFNSGQLMRLGTAARLWHKLEPTPAQYATFRETLAGARRVIEPAMELCYVPWSIEDGLRAALQEPPATLLVLPNGWVKVAAALPAICADLRSATLASAWDRYRAAWRSQATLDAMLHAIEDDSTHPHANRWQLMPATVSAATTRKTG